MIAEFDPFRPATVSRDAPKATASVARLSMRSRRMLAIKHREDIEALGGLPERPRTYGECERESLGVVRPCPWVGCVYHLALDVTGNGSLTFAWPGRELDELPATCALGVAARHADGLTLDEIGTLLNITRERVRQIESDGLTALRELSALVAVQDTEGE